MVCIFSFYDFHMVFNACNRVLFHQEGLCLLEISHPFCNKYGRLVFHRLTQLFQTCTNSILTNQQGILGNRRQNIWHTRIKQNWTRPENFWYLVLLNFQPLMPITTFQRRNWALSCAPNQLWELANFLWFPKIRSFKLFGIIWNVLLQKFL